MQHRLLPSSGDNASRYSDAPAPRKLRLVAVLLKVSPDDRRTGLSIQRQAHKLADPPGLLLGDDIRRGAIQTGRYRVRDGPQTPTMATSTAAAPPAAPSASLRRCLAMATSLVAFAAQLDDDATGQHGPAAVPRSGLDVTSILLRDQDASRASAIDTWPTSHPPS